MVTSVTRFRDILRADNCVAAAPIFDPLSARVAEMLGWQVSKLSGSFGKFANLAVPDGIPLSNMSDLVDVSRRITRISDTCLIVDADEGGGNALNVLRTVRELEAAGVCAIEIEDNLVPRTFGEAERRHSLMLSEEEQVGKLRAAVDAKRNADTVVVARTSALEELPRDAAMARIRAYSQTGAEALMFPALPNGAQDLKDIATATDLPIFVLGLDASVVADTALLRACRVKVRYLPHLPYRTAVQAMIEAYQHLENNSDSSGFGRPQASEERLRQLDRSHEMREWQERFVAT
ncbi:isocitrate lyase/PEP mutase family protein [Mesorhizobium sp. LHD-90]|uniref:isocitrate lyase/PEP mutase family protein n=1 Tax=Mesorhizobium sp. LHD-90 TaxID=3071414 RepID=UPI0027E063DF|nr:isocitrate lyase/PEP mutase family protein [Mesorhizobium sp. LHD-90]MDQ6436972.1 isocitrate lyase/PEP mutase family protein [Mesorhizobium sp. LHD-90]